MHNEVDTIDGVDKPTTQQPPTPRAPALTPASDYPELVTVERRHYQIGEQIAQGGMGRVLEARDLRLGRAVAIKELLPKNRDAARRFEREARITARLQHPAIIHIYEAGVWAGGEPFYAMTMVSGRSLDKVVAERDTLAERLALLPNVIAVADALAYAHNENVIHRDLKPANVLVGAFGETVVIDWGLAKDLGSPIDPMESMQLRRRDSPPDETNVGSVVGTPAYMPPEQARGESVDQRADVYALGALLYHVLVGRPPYVAKTASDVIELVKSAPCQPVRSRAPEAPPDLIAIVDKAMAREPEERYASAGELAQDLKRFQTGQLVGAHRYTQRELFFRFVKRYRVPIVVSLVALVALVVVGTLSVRQILEEKRASERRRNSLLEESGRADLLEGNFGRALVQLVGAAHDGEVNHARGFMIADALRPFEAPRATFSISGTGPLAVAYKAGRIVTVGATAIKVWSPAGTLERSFGNRRPLGIVLDPGGKRIAAIDDDHKIRIWSIEGKLERELTGHTSTILDAAFSPDGTQLVTASEDATARAWDLATGSVVVSRCHAKPVITARFSPNGKNVASADEDNLVCMWSLADPGNEDETTLLRSHLQRVHSVRWSPDGAFVLTASADGTARLTIVGKGKDAIVPLRHESGLGITGAEISHDGRSIVTTSLDRTAQVWEIPDELVVPGKARLVAKLVGHSESVDEAVFAADDTVIATVSRDGKARTWDASTGLPIAVFEHAEAVTSIAFSPDRARLLTASDGIGRLWDTTRGVARGDFEVGAVANTIATAGDLVAVARTDSRVTLWRAGKSTTLREHLGPVHAVAFSPDGNWLASAGDDPTVVIWNATTGERAYVLGPIEIALATRAVAYSPDGQLLVTAGDDGLVRLWSTETRTLKRTLRASSGLVALAYRGDGKMLVALAADGSLHVWDPGVEEPGEARVVMNGPARTLAFSHDGRRLVIGGKSDARIFTVEATRISSLALRLDGVIGDVRAVAFTTDDSRVITAGTDGAAKLWDAAKGKLVGVRDARSGAIHSIALTADGNTLWTAGEDRNARAWDIRVESRPVAQLDDLLAKRVPWRLREDDVVERK